MILTDKEKQFHMYLMEIKMHCDESMGLNKGSIASQFGLDGRCGACLTDKRYGFKVMDLVEGNIYVWTAGDMSITKTRYFMEAVEYYGTSRSKIRDKQAIRALEQEKFNDEAWLQFSCGMGGFPKDSRMIFDKAMEVACNKQVKTFN